MVGNRAAMSAKQRLQELFAKYDTNGDGTLTEEEVTPLFIRFGMTRGQLKALLQDFDKNKDGIIQIHEFLAWLTAEKPQVMISKNPWDGKDIDTNFSVRILNTSDRVGKKFHFYFKKCENMAFPEGNPCVFTVGPGQEMKDKVIMTVEKVPFSYRLPSWTARSAFSGVEDDVSKAFVDPDFPHEASSVGSSKTDFRCEQPDLWMRARMLGDPSEAVLFDQVRPQDIDQGGLGDCWLMAALACLAEYPAKLKGLFESKHITEDGKYQISLFDVEKMEWTPVIVDEFVPCKIRRGEPAPCFAEPLGEELWVLLLEKAVAKWCGSYGMLSGGFVAWAFQLLTGEADPVSYRRYKDNSWKRRYLGRKAQIQMGARSPRHAPFYYSKDKPVPMDDFFHVMKEHIDNHHVIAASMDGSPEKTEEAKGNGLYTRHVYSILNLLDEELDAGGRVKLIQLRNPWGNCEWTGDWNDCKGAQKWAENPKLWEKVNPPSKNDGSFYMPWEDFAKIYDNITICPVGAVKIPAAEEDPDAEEATDDPAD